MAKVREARHYQDPKAPVRRIATAAALQARASVKTALRALRDELDMEKVRTLIRHGRHREIAHTAIDWHHFEQVLRHPFERLARAYEAGAKLGERKINGAFAARGRGVRYRKGGPGVVSEESGRTVTRLLEMRAPEAEPEVTEALAILKRQSSVAFWKAFNPDQPRDEKGRFASTGASKPASEKMPSMKSVAKALSSGKMATFAVANDRISTSQREAVYDYKDGMYTAMNSHLYKESVGQKSDASGSTRAAIKAMAAAIEKGGRTTAGGVVYRGIGHQSVGDRDWSKEVGNKIKWPGFTSTSHDKNFAAGWAGHHASGALFRIYTPRGTRALEYGKMQGVMWDNEKEVILQRGTSFHVIGARLTSPPGAKHKRWEVDLVALKG